MSSPESPRLRRRSRGASTRCATTPETESSTVSSKLWRKVSLGAAPRGVVVDLGLAAPVLSAPSASAGDRHVPAHAPGGRSREGWPLSPYPDGDYFVFLAEDLRFGTFGHPWEHSLCVFGDDLLNAVQDDLHQLLPVVLRRNGKAPADASSDASRFAEPRGRSRRRRSAVRAMLRWAWPGRR
ncbi:DUF2716 domain-containing protein [Streptomyces sp. TLI_171]|uniref:DUF2716 domain-containing protein n=1 Tax=Streptomyces sp. TLI_171 TaxID=1938859 RepID=UPI0037DA0713